MHYMLLISHYHCGDEESRLTVQQCQVVSLLRGKLASFQLRHCPFHAMIRHVEDVLDLGHRRDGQNFFATFELVAI
jgi:hypothetical protein